MSDNLGKHPIKSKTMVINAVVLLLLAIVPDVEIFFGDMGWSTAWVVGAVAALNMVLRISTKGPVAMRLAVLRQGFRWLTGRKPK
jgi:hypothetical protein